MYDITERIGLFTASIEVAFRILFCVEIGSKEGEDTHSYEIVQGVEHWCHTSNFHREYQREGQVHK